MNTSDSIMEAVEKLFRYVTSYYPDTMVEIREIIKPYGIESLKKILYKHFEKNVPSLKPINARLEAFPNFLLAFCNVARRQFPQPGDALGIQLTCRITNRYTQQFLDVRHLKNESEISVCTQSAMNSTTKAIHNQINAFTEFSNILEISRNKIYSQILVCESLDELMRKIPNSCILERGSDKGIDLESTGVYLNARDFIISTSFLKNNTRILYKKKRNLDYLFRLISIENVVALTDLKFVYEKCGITCFFFNYLTVLKCQFFKKINLDSREEHDIVNVIRFQCSTGTPLPTNRNGLKKNPNRSAIEKLCFEAVKQNLADEAMRGEIYPVSDSTSKMFFGQRFNEGTGNDDFIPIVTNNKLE